MQYEIFERNAKVLVLSADSFNQTVSPEAQTNHVFRTKIYGDGRMVFTDPVRDSEIFEGHLEKKQISQLFELLKAKGFFELEESYSEPVMGGATAVITATRYGEPTKSVSCYGPGSAPPDFMDCFEALVYPNLRPNSVESYVREPITHAELDQGWYWGNEYQKKLDTPIDWVWIEAGRSSKWCRPAPHAVTLDSGYMTPSIDNCHHVRVHYNNDPTVGSTIQFDRNAMTPNEFGDIGVSTKMYFTPQPATCTLLEAKGDERLFSMSVPGYAGAHLRLVLFGDLARPSGGRLLELDDHDVIQNIHWLQAVPAA